MSAGVWALVLGATALVAYALLVSVLMITGRRTDARALAGFIPDCVVLCWHLLRDPRVPRSRKLALGGLALYLASPIDLVPDFIPVVGQLDDAILVMLVLRSVVRASGEAMIRENWPGPERSLAVIMRLVAR